MSDHFVVEINIKSVRKPLPPDARGARYAEKANAIDGAGGERIIEDVLRVVTKGDTLNDAIYAASEHLAVERKD